MDEPELPPSCRPPPPARQVARRLLLPRRVGLPRRDKLEALDLAVSLRFATAVVTKAGKSTEEQGPEHNREQLAATA
ncbi:MAG: hypothetical protein ACRDTH_15890 [Pseudonocardiaceae bacterium]